MAQNALKAVNLDGFVDDGLDACPLALKIGVAVIIGGHCDDWRAEKAVLRLGLLKLDDLLCGFQSVHDRHIDVGQNEAVVETTTGLVHILKKLIAQLLTVVGHVAVDLTFSEHVLQHIDVEWVVVRQQNSGLASAVLVRTSPRAFLL